MPTFSRDQSSAVADHRKWRTWSYAPVALVTLVCSIALFFAYRSLCKYSEIRAEEGLAVAGEQIADAIESELERYEQLLHLARGFSESSPGITRAKWAWFVHSIDLEQDDPGVVGLAYVTLVRPGQEDKFVQQMHARGVPGFEIFEHEWSDSSGHDGPKYVITFHEPASRNREVWGLDLASNSINKPVYDEAILRGQAQLSNAITLHQTAYHDTVGAVMCLPVYDVETNTHGTPKRGAPLGWVAMALDVDAIMANIWEERWAGLHLEVHANRPESDPVRWFSNGAAEAESDPPAAPDRTVYEREIEVHGNRMRLAWTPASDAWPGPDYAPANIALVVGGVITLLVTLVGVSISRTRSRAVRLAREMTDSLRVSERRQRELASRAEQANMAKSEFLANMSHEIRTPMTAILGYADILGESERDTSDTESIGAIRRAGEHLLMIINDVLDLTKIEAGRLKIETMPTELAPVVQDVMDGFRGLAGTKGVALKLVVTGDLPTHVLTDSVRVRQILINLVGNAIKFTSEGSVTLGIKFENDTLRFRVSDTGIGIEPTQLDRVFDPFEQGDNSPTRQHEGTGLGLAISRKLAAMLGGDLGAESQPGVGSTFTLTVGAPPAPDTGWTASLGARAPETEQTQDRESMTGRILLAEDGPDNQRLITYFLIQAGLEVDVVSNGREALERLNGDIAYDLFITDMQMPVMDGYTATACLREMGNTIPILALTAHAMDGDRERCLEVGCDDYEPKPISRESLMASVGRLLARDSDQGRQAA